MHRLYYAFRGLRPPSSSRLTPQEKSLADQFPLEQNLLKIVLLFSVNSKHFFELTTPTLHSTFWHNYLNCPSTECVLQILQDNTQYRQWAKNWLQYISSLRSILRRACKIPISLTVKRAGSQSKCIYFQRDWIYG